MSGRNPVAADGTVLVVDPDGAVAQGVADAVDPTEVHHIESLDGLGAALAAVPIAVVVVGPGVAFDEAVEAFQDARSAGRTEGCVVIARRPSLKMMRAAMGAQITDVLAVAHEPGELADAVRRAWPEPFGDVHAPPPVEQPRVTPATVGQVVTVFSAKGGCGKSTVAANLGVLLTQRGQRVCILDLDLQFGDAAIMFQLQPELTIADAVLSFDDLDAESIKDFVSVHESGVSVLPGPASPAQADDVTAADVERLLGLLRSAYDWVIVDTPAMFTDQVLTAIDAANRLVMLSSFDVPSIKNLRLGLSTLRQLGVDPARTDVVMVRADARVGLRIKEVERTIGATIDVAIPSDRDVTISLNHGIPLALEQPKSAVVTAIRLLADRVQGEVAVQAATSPAQRVLRRRSQRASATVNT